MSNSILISVIVTCHSEGILLHRTLRSVYSNLNTFAKPISYEVIVHADNPTQYTINYLANIQHYFPEVKVYKNNFKDLGLSRNFAISKANGKYIATIDADDLMSTNWLSTSLEFLEKQSRPTFTQSEVTVEFEGRNALILKHGEIDKSTDALLSVYANRWNSVIVAPRSLLIEEPYVANSAGYGYEDWNLNCRFIARGAHCALMPETAIFVRRKRANSEWDRQRQSGAVLRANPLLSLAFVRKLNNPFNYLAATHENALSSRQLRSQVKKLVKRHSLIHKVAKRAKAGLSLFEAPRRPVTIPAWLNNEWREMHEIDRQLFPSKSLLRSLDVYDSITTDHKTAGYLYKTIVDRLAYDRYDYVLFVPWLLRGGADKYAIGYANGIAAAREEKKVLVVSTMPKKSEWQAKLNDGVDYLDFGTISEDMSYEIKHRVMSHLIENAGISHIHIINSEFGYDFVRTYENYIRATNKKVIVTSFSQSVATDGRLYGYSHTHVPLVYELASYITSDNRAVIEMWEAEYGFDKKKMHIHNYPVTPSRQLTPSTGSEDGVFRVLWASRLAPEKLVDLVPKIGALLQGKSICIDMYGTPDHDFKISSLRNLPSNVRYGGAFVDFFELPLEDYDVFLYTSLFDGMPHILLEASVAKLPIVASGVGGIPNFIEDTNGVAVHDIHEPEAYAKEIMRLAEDSDLRARLATHAHQKVTREHGRESYNSAIEKMLDRLSY